MKVNGCSFCIKQKQEFHLHLILTKRKRYSLVLMYLQAAGENGYKRLPVWIKFDCNGSQREKVRWERSKNSRKEESIYYLLAKRIQLHVL